MICKQALAHLVMWVRNRHFPPSYAQAICKPLLPFFSFLAPSMVQVELHPFNDGALTGFGVPGQNVS
jgi:hypothetical protein